MDGRERSSRKHIREVNEGRTALRLEGKARSMTQFYGKYRGQVVDNMDPRQLGRIKVLVPALDRTTTFWALPCMPYAAPQVGLLFLPPVDAVVWIEFEGGDPNYPIWSGCFWERIDEMPTVITPPPAK
jgi:uncharacterized protein involved in type VI secretion and phage assembly